MTFLAPLFFWSFVSFIPLVAVYFLKVRPRRKETTAYFLWQRVFTERKTASLFQRLRDLLSLVLMSLVFGSVCLALTRPELETAERRDLLLLIDNSAGMAAGEGAQQRMALAKEAARDLVRGLDSNQRASVATVAGSIRFLSHLTDDPRQLLDAIDAIQPAPFPSRRSALAALHAGDSAAWMRGHRLVLITDGAFGSEGPPDGVEVLKVGAPLENAGIAGADAAFLPDGTTLGLFLQFASSFRQPVQATLTLRPVPEGAGRAIELDIAPGLSAGRVYQVPDAAPGEWRATLELKDAWAGDNEVLLIAQRPRPLRVDVAAEDRFFFDAAVQSFTGGGGLLMLSPENPHVVIARGRSSGAPFSVIFQPQGDSPWWQAAGETLETAVPRVRVPDHPVLRHLDAAGLNFAGARKIIPASGALVLVESTDGVPLLYTASAGGRSALVVNMDPVAADFFYSAWFPVLIYSATTHLSGRGELLAATYRPGDSIPLPGAADDSSTTVEDPAGDVTAITGRRHGPLTRPGLYRLRNSSGESLAAVNLLAPEESLLDNTSTAHTLQPIARGTPPYLLLTLLALGVLVVESLLYHRRKVG